MLIFLIAVNFFALTHLSFSPSGGVTSAVSYSRALQLFPGAEVFFVGAEQLP